MIVSRSGLSSRIRPALGTGLALSVLVLVGCRGHDQKSNVPLVPVTGTVTLDDKPLADAELNFIPEGSTLGHGGYAKTGQDGSYTASTPFGEPGLAAGDYRVVIQKHVTPDGKPFSGPIDPNIPPIESPYSELLPAIYSDQNASTLKSNVSADSPKPINFALKSARKRP